MRHHRAHLLAIVAIGLLTVAASAQQSDRARALDEQIGRIFQANEYRLPRFGPRFAKDASMLTPCRRYWRRPAIAPGGAASFRLD